MSDDPGYLDEDWWREKLDEQPGMFGRMMDDIFGTPLLREGESGRGDADISGDAD